MLSKELEFLCTSAFPYYKWLIKYNHIPWIIEILFLKYVPFSNLMKKFKGWLSYTLFKKMLIYYYKLIMQIAKTDTEKIELYFLENHPFRWLVPNWIWIWNQLSTNNRHSRNWSCQGFESMLHDVLLNCNCWGMINYNELYLRAYCYYPLANYNCTFFCIQLKFWILASAILVSKFIYPLGILLDKIISNVKLYYLYLLIFCCN